MKNDNITSNLHELREANSARERGRELPDRLSDQNLPVWNLRVKFQKIGRLQFISHLDLARTMRTAIVRAGIPVKYSQGFNPHPRMSFALQLSVGTQSKCEFMELKLCDKPDCDKIKSELNKNLVDELRVFDVYEPERKASEIAWAEYSIIFYPQPFETLPDYNEIIGDKLVISKRTKSGEKEVDIRPQILRFYQSDNNIINTVLCADNTSYLNPEYIAKLAGVTDYDIIRQRCFLSDGVTELR